MQYPTFWANGVLATVANPPPPIVEVADGWIGYVRKSARRPADSALLGPAP
jgi:hypothetical protein